MVYVLNPLIPSLCTQKENLPCLALTGWLPMNSFGRCAFGRSILAFKFTLFHLVFHLTIINSICHMSPWYMHIPCSSRISSFFIPLHYVVVEKSYFTCNLNHESLFALGQFPSAPFWELVQRLGLCVKALQLSRQVPELRRGQVCGSCLLSRMHSLALPGIGGGRPGDLCRLQGEAD